MLAIAAGGCLLVGLLAGCSKILPFFFDGAPKEGQPVPTRRVRRDLLQEIEQLKRQLSEAQAAAKARQEGAEPERAKLPVEDAKTWEEAGKLLPKDAAGNVNWVEAIRKGTVAPRPGPDSKAPEQQVLDLDVEVASSRSKLFSVTYPHAAHTEWLSCQNCHPAIFPLKRQGEPTVITMAKIRQGQYCGVCHGKVAFSVEGACVRCHAKIPATTDWRPTEEPQKPIERARKWDDVAKLLPVTAGGPDWAKALADGVIAPRPGLDPKAGDEPVFPLDVELVPADNPTFKAVFPHETHTAVLSCTSCHPGIFQMQRGADPITMEKIFAGEYCGRCHGNVAFAVATGCPRCHPAFGGS